MFYHSKELQFKARVSKPDPRFARLLLEQFGGGNGELKAAMQYFVQAFACHNPYPDKYDMLMDIATERNDVFGEGISKDDFIHSAFSVNPQFGVLTGGGPRLTDSNGVPWQGSYVNANSDLTVDLRSDIAAESRAKIVYEYLMQFTDDKDVLATLNFLMTREVAHFQQFEAALDTIQPNFPPGVLQSDPRYSNIYSNHSMGEDARGPWNEGEIRASRYSKPTGSPNSNRRAHPARRLRCAARTRSSASSAAAKSARLRRRKTSSGASTIRRTRKRPGASRSDRIDATAGLQVRTPRGNSGAFILFSMYFATKTRKY